MPVLLTLRELAKYKILFIVKEIRFELLRLARLKKIDNIFDKIYSEILLLYKSL